MKWSSCSLSHCKAIDSTQRLSSDFRHGCAISEKVSLVCLSRNKDQGILSGKRNGHSSEWDIHLLNHSQQGKLCADGLARACWSSDKAVVIRLIQGIEDLHETFLFIDSSPT